MVGASYTSFIEPASELCMKKHIMRICFQIQRIPALTARVNCMLAVNQGGTAESFGP